MEYEIIKNPMGLIQFTMKKEETINSIYYEKRRNHNS
jgi:hypothetical protein